MSVLFIVIDESELDCFIARKIIKYTDGTFNIKIYQDAQSALDMIRTPTVRDAELVIILLDLQMPIMNGFQFVQAFEKLPPKIRHNYRIILLSSTRNPNDISRMLSFDSVYSAMEKPLTKEKLTEALQRIKNKDEKPEYLRK